MDGTNSCKECKKRYVGCHSQCEEYIEWVKQWKIKKEKINNGYRNRNVGYYHK